MSIDKDILDQLMEGRAPGDLFGKDGILSELTKALAARRNPLRQVPEGLLVGMCIFCRRHVLVMNPDTRAFLFR